MHNEPLALKINQEAIEQVLKLKKSVLGEMAISIICVILGYYVIQFGLSLTPDPEKLGMPGAVIFLGGILMLFSSIFVIGGISFFLTFGSEKKIRRFINEQMEIRGRGCYDPQYRQ